MDTNVATGIEKPGFRASSPDVAMLQTRRKYIKTSCMNFNIYSHDLLNQLGLPVEANIGIKASSSSRQNSRKAKRVKT